MRARHGLASILTPHPLEAARLLRVATREVQADRLRAAARLAGELQATIVLKGSGTVVCTPGLATGINSTGGPALASGGTGDVLAGWLGGRWSRRRGEVPAAHESAHAVAQQTVWLHGAAAEPGTVRGDTVRAQDLIDRMRHLAAQPLP
jgi:NAD(P)H-hydrate repair Nnr-like enzyme with NAD(P)H-hydrate dehydratase domain